MPDATAVYAAYFSEEEGVTDRELSGATPTIAFLKGWRSRALDVLSPQRVVFHHVPKCGGTSVGAALRQRYILSQATVTPESSFRAFEAFTGRTDRDQMLIDVLDLREQMLLYWLYEDVRCVSLHARFSNAAYERFRGQYKFITILREPISRFISHYLYSHGRPNGHARIQESLEAFLESPRAGRLGASYVEFFCGLPKEADVTTSESIDAAISNLRKFDVVGRLDDLNAFATALKEQLGVRLRIGHENKARQPEAAKKQLLTPDIQNEIKKICAPDLALWKQYFPESQPHSKAVR